MRRRSLVVLVLFFLSSLPAYSSELAVEEALVLRDFEQILDLWRDGRYEELYERTGRGGRHGREQFVKRLAAAPRKPACCWEKLQEVQITLNGERAALVHAKLGFEGSIPGTEFVTRGIRLRKEGKNWVIPQGELFSLSKAGKKRSYRYLGPSPPHPSP